ncbi:hypothetical protein ILUMI_17958 [Ignelater luminosus]|uniref:C2H2-type domain-containing protein n=1 Tax=Ignelater luminosus TaxID=2038154 RepID=A0A8K0CJ85_IGNLU|nr:hypothetical protein ILUMI_17958 [Ignelater luminosus]
MRTSLQTEKPFAKTSKIRMWKQRQIQMCSVELYFLGYSANIESYDEQAYVCMNCQRKYKYKGNLQAHLKHECGKEPRFVCDINNCDYRTKKKSDLKRHQILRHFKVLMK